MNTKTYLQQKPVEMFNIYNGEIVVLVRTQVQVYPKDMVTQLPPLLMSTFTYTQKNN